MRALTKVDHILVVREDESYEYVAPEEIVARLKREGDTIIVEYDDFVNPSEIFIYPGLLDFDTKTKEIVNIYKGYRGTGKPRLYPKCELLERGINYVVIERFDGARFRINHAFPGEILLNILNNPGIALWDLISLEVLVFTKEYPDITEKELLDIIDFTVDVVGYYTYVLDLVEVTF